MAYFFPFFSVLSTTALYEKQKLNKKIIFNETFRLRNQNQTLQQQEVSKAVFITACCTLVFLFL